MYCTLEGVGEQPQGGGEWVDVGRKLRTPSGVSKSIEQRRLEAEGYDEKTGGRWRMTMRGPIRYAGTVWWIDDDIALILNLIRCSPGMRMSARCMLVGRRLQVYCDRALKSTKGCH